MKKLYIIRHAKSNWDNAAHHDIERPLAERGEKDAQLMGKILAKNHVLPDIIFSSPALRAFTTARIISDEINYDKNKLHIGNELYFGNEDAIIRLIQSFDTKAETAFIVGHNPTFSNLAAALCDTFHAEMPTCGIVGLEFNAGSWKQIEKGAGKLALYDYPKKFR